MDKIIEFLLKRLNPSEEDAIVAAIFAICGFAIDALFFPAGMPPLTVTILSGAGGMLISRWLKSRKFFLERSLKQIDKLVKQEHLTPEQGERYKRRLIEKWLESTKGLSPEDDQKRLP